MASARAPSAGCRVLAQHTSVTLSAALPHWPVFPRLCVLGGGARDELEVRVDFTTILEAMPPIGWEAVSPTHWIACGRPRCCILGHA